MNKKSKVYVISTLLLFLFTGSLFLCLLKYKHIDNKELHPNSTLDQVTICHAPRLDTLILVAQHQGFFKKNNIDVTLKKFAAGSDSLQNMIDGGCDFSVSGVVSFVFTNFKTDTIKILATVAVTENASTVVARKDVGIKTHADLKGKRIAVQKGSSFHFFLYLFLAKHRISLEDVDISFEEIANMTKNEIWEKYDAIIIKEPFTTSIVKTLGKNAIVFEDPGLLYSPKLLTCSDNYTHTSPETIKNILKALLQAEIFSHRNPNDVLDILVDAHGLDREKWKSILSEIELKVSLDQTMLTTLEEIARWTIMEGFSGTKKEIPHFFDHIYFNGLASVKPEAITIIR